MTPARSGAFRIFSFRGIDVFLHWWWFVLAWIEISSRQGLYTSIVWNIAEYVGLFAIVLLHEFGHAFACRSVGGVANEIILWPLGGIAFAKPPPRVKAELWTIAAGPLVNVVLFPVLMLAAGSMDPRTDLGLLVFMLWTINKWLLLFNLLPIYPLDGGQILRSLLWFKVGRARSLQIATVIGFIGIALLAGFRMIVSPNNWVWTIFFTLFLGQQCFAGYRHAQALRTIERLPRHAGFACPECHKAPPGGPLWICRHCGNRFDPFSTLAICPHCQNELAAITCVHCSTAHSIARWNASSPHPASGESPIIEV